MPENETFAGQADRWFKKAQEDLAWSRYAARGSFFSQACFGCQQVAEKALKAYLFSQEQDLIRTHSLPQLLERCKDFDEGFGALEDACAVLTVYYVDTRYPELDLPFGEQEAQEAIELAAQVVAFVGERIAP